MTNTYNPQDSNNIKLGEESRCIEMVVKKLRDTMDQPYVEEKIPDDLVEEFRLIRCLMERTLRVMSEGHFCDYQGEKASYVGRE